ncbi:MAG: tetratricopeptide repeat protein, partial [Pseudomonadota bacterium]
RGRAVQLARNACNAGNTTACYYLASWGEGAGIPSEQIQKGLGGIEYSCQLGEAQSCVSAGLAYKQGYGVRADRAKALQFQERACDLGNLDGCYNFGATLVAGGSTAEKARAAQIFEEACDAGEMWSCASHGQNLYLGLDGVAKNRRAGRRLLRESCEAGAPLGCQALEAFDLN